MLEGGPSEAEAGWIARQYTDSVNSGRGCRGWQCVTLYCKLGEGGGGGEADAHIELFLASNPS